MVPTKKASWRIRVIHGAEKGFWGTARGAFAAGLIATVFSAAAANELPRTAAGDVPPMNAEMVTPGLYRISGAGGTLVRLSANGPIVVDSSRAGTYRPLMAEIQRVAKAADRPARALILTAAGPDQGNVAQFVDAGVPVIVQKRALERFAQYGHASGAMAPKPFITYEMDYVLQAGGIQVEVEHVGSGRTGADSVVFFRDLRVVAVGELFTHGTPEPDCASGGSFAGWASAIIHLLWFDFDIAVPSRGAPVGKSELLAFKAELEALARRGGPSPSGQSDCQPPR